MTGRNWWHLLDGTSTARPVLQSGRLLFTLRRGQNSSIQSLSLIRNEPVVELKSGDNSALALKINGQVGVLTQDDEASAVQIKPLSTPLQPGNVTRKYWRRLEGCH